MPLPLPMSLVLKNGSNMRSMTSGPMPVPESATESWANSPLNVCLQLEHVIALSCTRSAPTTMRPLSPIASRALMQRFNTT